MMKDKKLIYGILVIAVLAIAGIGLLVLNRPSTTPTPTQEVTITTDKTEYEQGEMIKITLKNNLKESVFSHVGSGTPGFSIEYVERKTTNGDWEKLFAQCQYPYCIYDIDAPAEIKPDQSKTFEWEPLIFINGTSESVQAGSGIYRLVILYQIRKGPSSENWAWKTIRSNEFTIK